MKETQYDVIKKLHKAKEWVCANDYRAHYIPYFWKRQAEMYKYVFTSKPCEHGTKKGLDYRMVEIAGTIDSKTEAVHYRPDYLKQQKLESARLI